MTNYLMGVVINSENINYLYKDNIISYNYNK